MDAMPGLTFDRCVVNRLGAFETPAEAGLANIDLDPASLERYVARSPVGAGATPNADWT